MEFKLIKNRNDYILALAQMDQLILDDNQADDDKVELLATLIEMYENEFYTIELPDPVDAIRFRMEQLELNNKDLIPILGGKNRVSEIMNHKKPLTLKMIRALNQKLNISAEVLLNELGSDIPNEYSDVDWTKIPMQEIKRRYSKIIQNMDDTERFLRDIFKNIKGDIAPDFALCRQSHHASKVDSEINYALFSWCLLLIYQAKQQKVLGRFRQESINEDFLSDVVKLSCFDNGPLLAKEYLSRFGINLVILPHLSKTYVDGVVIKTEDFPVIGMSLRYDRIDNFWFTLIHELSHIAKHYEEQSHIIVDDLDSNIHCSSTEIEIEADELTKKILLYEEIDIELKKSLTRNSKKINEIASKLRINPAIIAGKIRHEEHNYKIYGNLVGNKEVRCLLMPTEIY